MNKTIIAAAAATIVAAAAPASAQMARAGSLECDVSGGVGMVITSSKALDCLFFRDDGAPPEHYVGTIKRFGVALGATGPGHLDWLVATSTNRIGPGALTGDYGGVGASATAGVGLGANALVGGSNRTVSLQPFSVQAQVGVDVAAGVTSMELDFVPPPPKVRARRHR